MRIVKIMTFIINVMFKTWASQVKIWLVNPNSYWIEEPSIPLWMASNG